MGVSGSGKSTLGAALAAELSVPFVDADDLHSAEARAKMAGGTPLDDADRAPWLGRVADRITADAAAHGGVVVACSALRRRYRDALRARAGVPLTFVHAEASPELIAERMTARAEHFMPPALLASQLQTLEPLGDDEAGFAVDMAAPLPAVVADAVARLTP